jgi:hypothetical protein
MAKETPGEKTYGGRERRKKKGAVRGEVSHDAKGNPVWRMSTDVPRRRQDDDTVDLLKCLDVEDLSLADDVPREDASEGYDPYDRGKSKKK